MVLLNTWIQKNNGSVVRMLLGVQSHSTPHF